MGEASDIIHAVGEVAKNVPIYPDLIQPGAKQAGKVLATTVGVINMALSPIQAMVWGYEKISQLLGERLSQKLANVVPNIQSPDILIAGPAVEALRFAAQNEELRELYLNLLATSMDRQTAHTAHPGFVHIIQNISPDEAKILSAFAKQSSSPLLQIQLLSPNIKGHAVLRNNFSLIGRKVNCQHLELVPNYIDNLCRLGLLEVPWGSSLTADGIYNEIENDSEVINYKLQYELNPEHTIQLERGLLRITDFGQQFLNACLINKNSDSEI